MKVAVVGANGFIGRRLCGALRDARVDVLQISSKSEGGFDVDNGLLQGLPIEPGVTAVVYLSQSPLYRDMPASAAHLWGVNVLSAIKAAEWARRSGAARFIYASTGNVYRPSFAPLREDDPLQRDDWYALSKVQAEEALGLYRAHMNVTCVRLFGVYGPGQRGRLVPNLVESMRQRRPIGLALHPTNPDDTGGVRLTLTYVDDVAAVLHHLVANDGPGTLNLAGSEVHSVREMAMVIGEWLDCEPVFSQQAPRHGDFIGDNSRLLAVWPGAFRGFAAGIVETLKAPQTT